MASFIPQKLNKLEEEVGSLEIHDLPVNLTNKIGEGTSASIYKHLRHKPAAIKLFKKQFSKKKDNGNCKSIKEAAEQ